MEKIPYSSAVESLMYAHVCTRPDIAFAISVLGIYLSNPGLSHWKAAKKVIRYFQGYVDNRKSTSGYIFMVPGGAVSWKSIKQTLTATSTMEAEYVACYEATCQAIWLENSSRSKHFDVKFLFVREKIRESQTRIEYITTDRMIADPLTKTLPISVFQKHVAHMGVVKTFDDALV
ncbi:secreted RxLR effector protein 161-like [Hevea brasiliensis]|uniref:secreted RxLR effector protein 161-like n=1 Tax=Hevea brasiliensis TaxID=3981 RepID=UPI0025CC854D|nr:secreted RxLR effector protein 161-like [Hevea brasiliensis]